MGFWDDDDAQITQAYEQYLGRDPEAGALEAHHGNPGGLQAVLDLIRNGEEAQQYRAQQSSGGSYNGSGINPGGMYSGGSTPSFNGDYIGYFNSLFPGESLTPADLTAKRDELAKVGIQLAPNAAGVNAKIRLPDGQIVDVIQGAASGLNRKQWLTGGGTNAPNAYGNLFAGYQGGDPAGFGAAPSPYQSEPYTGPGFELPNKPASLSQPLELAQWTGSFDTPPPTFTAPTGIDYVNDPGYKERLAMGVDARERSAAAKGSILGGGQQKALERYGQDYASNEFGNVFNRALSTFGAQNQTFANLFDQYRQKYGEFNQGEDRKVQARGLGLNEYQTDINAGNLAYQNRYGQYLNEQARTLSDYLTNTNTQRNAAGDYWGRLRDLSQEGLQASLGSRVS